MYDKNIDYKKKYLKYKEKYDQIIEYKKLQNGGGDNRSKIISSLKLSKNLNYDAFKLKAIGLLYMYAFDSDKKRNKIDQKYKKEGGLVSYLSSLDKKKFNQKYVKIIKNIK